MRRFQTPSPNAVHSVRHKRGNACDRSPGYRGRDMPPNRRPQHESGARAVTSQRTSVRATFRHHSCAGPCVHRGPAPAWGDRSRPSRPRPRPWTRHHPDESTSAFLTPECADGADNADDRHFAGGVIYVEYAIALGGVRNRQAHAQLGSQCDDVAISAGARGPSPPGPIPIGIKRFADAECEMTFGRWLRANTKDWEDTEDRGPGSRPSPPSRPVADTPDQRDTARDRPQDSVRARRSSPLATASSGTTTGGSRRRWPRDVVRDSVIHRRIVRPAAEVRSRVAGFSKRADVSISNFASEGMWRHAMTPGRARSTSVGGTAWHHKEGCDARVLSALRAIAFEACQPAYRRRSRPREGSTEGDTGAPCPQAGP